MPWTDAESFRFTIKLALRRAFRLVRGLSKQVSDSEVELMATEIAAEIKRSNWIVKRGEPTVGGRGP
jgi:hypothetical protein